MCQSSTHHRPPPIMLSYKETVEDRLNVFSTCTSFSLAIEPDLLGHVEEQFVSSRTKQFHSYNHLQSYVSQSLSQIWWKNLSISCRRSCRLSNKNACNVQRVNTICCQLRLGSAGRFDGREGTCLPFDSRTGLEAQVGLSPSINNE